MSDETKLPKWAQRLIGGLRHENKELRRALDGYERKAEHSPFVAEYLSPIKEASRDIPILYKGLSSITIFPDGGCDKYRDSVRVSLNVHSPGWVRVESDDIEVRPQASNLIWVRPGK